MNEESVFLSIYHIFNCMLQSNYILNNKVFLIGKKNTWFSHTFIVLVSVCAYVCVIQKQPVSHSAYKLFNIRDS